MLVNCCNYAICSFYPSNYIIPFSHHAETKSDVGKPGSDDHENLFDDDDDPVSVGCIFQLFVHSYIFDLLVLTIKLLA